MPSLAEVLLNVQGHSEGAQEAVRSVADEIRRVPNTATTTFKATVTDLDAKLKAVDAQLSAVDRRRVSPKISANIDKMLADLTAARAYLDSLPDHKTIDLQARGSIEGTLARISAQMAAMGLQAGQWGDEMERAATAAESKIPRTVNIDLRATKQNLERDLNDAETTLRMFSGRSDIAPQAHLKVDQLLVDVMKARAILDTLPDHKDVDLRTRAGVEQDLLRIKNLIGDVAGEADKGAQAFTNMGSAAGSGGGGGAIKELLDGLGSLSPLLQGIGIVLLVSLLPALGALIASLGSAAAGVGALAVAFAGALGPGLLFLLDIVKRLTDVMQAYQAVSNAQSTTTRDSAQASQEAAQNAEQQYIAQQGVQRAVDNLRESEQRLADARRQAATGLVQSHHDEQNALYQLDQANKQVALAQLDGYRAIEDAIMRVRDAVLGLENAQLGMQDAKLRIDSAKQALVDFRDQAGLTGQAFDQLFKRLSNVNIEQNPQVVRNLLAQITQQGGLSGDDAIRLRQLILDLAHAQNDAKGAANNLTKAQQELSRARQDELPLLQRGIDAYKPYIDALHAQADAQYNAQKAVAAYDLAQQQGIERNPQVLSALKAVQTATIQLADAQHRLALAAEFGPSSMQSAWEQANQALAKLTPTERAFVSELQAFVTFLHSTLQPATDAVFGALGHSLTVVQGLLGALTGDIQGMGQAWGRSVNEFTAGMANPHMLDNWHALVQASGKLAEILGGRAFTAFVQLMTNLARAAMPELIKLASELAVWLQAAAGGTDNIKELSQWLQPFFQSLEVWLTALGQLMDLVIAFFRTVGPYGDQLVRWLGQAFENMAKWLGSKQGQDEMRRFFADLLPMSKDIVTVLGKLAVAALLFMQDFGPAFHGALQIFGQLLDVVNLLLRAFSHLPAPLREVIGMIAGVVGAFLTLRTIKAILGRIAPELLDAFAPLGRIAGIIGRFLLNPLRAIGTLVRTFVIPAIEAIGEGIGILAAIVGAPVEVIVAAIALIVGVAVLVATHWRQTKDLIIQAWDNLKISASAVANWIVGAWHWAIGAVRDAVNWIIGAIDWFIDKWNSTSLAKGIHFNTPLGHVDIDGITIPRIPKLQLGGIVNADTLARIGEGASSEAVLPLTDSTYERLGDAIAKKMPKTAAGGGLVQHNTFEIHSPAGTNPDPGFVTARIAENMRRRGLQLIGVIA